MNEEQARINLEKRWAGPVKRACAECTACCDYFEIEEIEKASHSTCPFLKNGCSLYDDHSKRPKACVEYICAWAMGFGTEGDRPDKSGAIVDYRDGLAGVQLYGHLTREPNEDTLDLLERFSEEAGLDIFLEKKG